MRYFLLLLLAFPAFAQGVRVKAERMEGANKITSWGSGCFVGKHKVLTASNVVDKGQVFAEVKGAWVPCKLLKKDGDLALLECEAKHEVVELLPLPVLSVSGSQKSKPVTERSLLISSVLVKGDIEDGDSGAPVLAEGRLIGMIVSRVKIGEEWFGRFVDAGQIADLLK